MQTKATYSIILMLLFIVIVSNTSQAQERPLIRQTISMCGGSNVINLNGEKLLAQQSVGQSSVIGTYQSKNNTIRQGFLQPNFKRAVVFQEEELNLSIYPNPFQNDLNIILEEPSSSTLYIRLLDLRGRTVKSEQRNAAELLQFNWSGIENGAYLLEIRLDQKISITNIQKL